jgi:hypothetical protein
MSWCPRLSRQVSMFILTASHIITCMPRTTRHGMLVMSKTYRNGQKGMVVSLITCCSLKNMARLGVEPRLPEYIPGALPTELPSQGESMGWLLFCHLNLWTDCTSNTPSQSGPSIELAFTIRAHNLLEPKSTLGTVSYVVHLWEEQFAYPQSYEYEWLREKVVQTSSVRWMVDHMWKEDGIVISSWLVDLTHIYNVEHEIHGLVIGSTWTNSSVENPRVLWSLRHQICQKPECVARKRALSL